MRLKISHTQEQELARQGIETQYQRIRDALKSVGLAQNDKDVVVKIGPELEITFVGGKDAFMRRIAHFVAGDGFDLEFRDDSHMPEKARVGHVNRVMIGEASPGSNIKRIRLVNEVNMTSQLGSRPRVVIGKHGYPEMSMEFEAFKPTELVSPPRSPLGAAEWFQQINQRITDSAPKMELKRIMIHSHPHDETVANGIHLNMSVKVGDKNLFDLDAFDGKKRTGTVENPKRLSELALCVGHASNKFLREGGLFLLAPAQSCYKRYDPNVFVGPSFIGVTTRKALGAFGSAMFRGGGRIAARLEDSEENKAKSGGGDLRFELRVVAPEAAGHPKKRTHPSQRAFPYRMVEAAMMILADGVEEYALREVGRASGKKIPKLTERGLFKAHLLEDDKLNPEFLLPWRKRDAVTAFRHNERLTAYYGDRVETIVAEASRLDEIARQESSPFSKGSRGR